MVQRNNSQSAERSGRTPRTLRKRVEKLVSQLGHADTARREEAINELARMGQAAVPALIAAVDQPDPMINLGALQALGDIGKPAESAVPRILAALRNGPGRIRFTAAWALSRIRDTRRHVIQALMDALGDVEPRVRRQAARTLGFLRDAAWEAAAALRGRKGGQRDFIWRNDLGIRALESGTGHSASFWLGGHDEPKTEPLPVRSRVATMPLCPGGKPGHT